jgi:hypothetical protein
MAATKCSMQEVICVFRRRGNLVVGCEAVVAVYQCARLFSTCTLVAFCPNISSSM